MDVIYSALLAWLITYIIILVLAFITVGLMSFFQYSKPYTQFLYNTIEVFSFIINHRFLICTTIAGIVLVSEITW